MSEITREMWEQLQEENRILRRNEEMYRVAMGLTDHTITVVDVKERSLSQIYNEGDWTGIANTMMDAPESIIATGIIHPEDCDGYRKFYEDIYSGVPRGEFTMRVMEEHRGWVWFTMYYQTVFNEDGTPNRAICFSDDITVKKRAEDKFEQFKKAVVEKSDYVWEINLTTDEVISAQSKVPGSLSNWKQMSYSQLAETATAHVKDEMYKKAVKSFYSRENLLEAFKHGKLEFSLEHPYSNDEGDGYMWLYTTAYIITNLQEEIILMLCSRDVTDSHQEREHLIDQAERDGLTGLLNRTTLIHHASRIMRENSYSMNALAVIDVDDFKQFNDTHGHDYGDKVLQYVAGVMKERFRATDLACRYGGDEFVLFLRNIGSMDIKATLEQLISLLAKKCQKEKLPEIITLSIGVTLSSPTDNFETLFKRADEALYESKRKGKNQVTAR